MSEQALFFQSQPSCRWGVDLRVELMKQSHFFIALKRDTSRKQLKCMPYFILWTALLSFEEGGGGRGPSGVTFYSDTISNLQKSCMNSTRKSHIPFTYIHLFTFCSTCFTVHSLYSSFPLHPSLPLSLSSSPSPIHIFFPLPFWEYAGHIIPLYPYICWLFPKNKGFSLHDHCIIIKIMSVF